MVSCRPEKIPSNPFCLALTWFILAGFASQIRGDDTSQLLPQLDGKPAGPAPNHAHLYRRRQSRRVPKRPTVQPRDCHTTASW